MKAQYNNAESAVLDVLRSMDIPPADLAEGVLKAIRARRRKRPYRAMLIAVAVVCSALLLMGAGKLAEMTWQGKWFKFDGSAGDLYYSSDELWLTGKSIQFAREILPDEFRMVIRKVGEGNIRTMAMFPFENVTDYDVLAGIFEGGGLSLPGYLPEGYTFKEARVGYYLSQDDLNDFKLLESYEQDGIIYEVYTLPPQVNRQISDVLLYYASADGGQLTMSYTYTADGDPKLYTDFDTATFTALTVDGYDDAALVENSDMGDRTLYFGKAIPAFECSLGVGEIGYQQRLEKYGIEKVGTVQSGVPMSRAYKFINIRTHVVSAKGEQLSTEELIRVAESMKS